MEDRAASIIELRGQGLSYQQIADALGTSRGTVWKALKNGDGKSGPVRQSAVRSAVVHQCATPGCGRELRSERWIYSGHTGLRYCWPGEGCTKWSPDKRRRARAAQEGVAAA